MFRGAADTHLWCADTLHARGGGTHDPSLAWLLERGEELLDGVHSRGWGLLRSWCLLTAVMTLCAGGYGAVFGMWHGGRLALYVAAKFPLVLLLTAALTLLFNWIAALLLEVPLRFLQVAVLTFLTLAIASVVLASLAPIAWIFTLAAPAPSESARTAHNLLYLMHTAFVAGSGMVGSGVLWRALVRVAGPRAMATYWLWVAGFAFAGGEVAWALRPFVGSVYYPVVFLRPDALEGNVYEFIWTDILPHFLSNYD